MIWPSDPINRNGDSSTSSVVTPRFVAASARAESASAHVVTCTSALSSMSSSRSPALVRTQATRSRIVSNAKPPGMTAPSTPWVRPVNCTICA